MPPAHRRRCNVTRLFTAIKTRKPLGKTEKVSFERTLLKDGSCCNRSISVIGNLDTADEAVRELFDYLITAYSADNEGSDDKLKSLFADIEGIVERHNLMLPSQEQAWRLRLENGTYRPILRAKEEKEKKLRKQIADLTGKPYRE